MAVSYDDEIKDAVCGDVSLRVECNEREVTIEDSCGRRCVLEYDQLTFLNEMVSKFHKMQEVANG